MKIADSYSHLNGLEFLFVHRPTLWLEIQHVVALVDAKACYIKSSTNKGELGQSFYNSTAMHFAFKKVLYDLGWMKNRNFDYQPQPQTQTRSRTSTQQMITAGAIERTQEILPISKPPINCYTQTDYEKDRVAVEVQFGKCAFVAYDLFVKHLAFYVRDEIDVGIEILPMKALQTQMSSGVAYYEGEFYNVIRNGRGVPSVPLVLIGIDV